MDILGNEVVGIFVLVVKDLFLFAVFLRLGCVVSFLEEYEV